jgi:hypothetical protein
LGTQGWRRPAEALSGESRRDGRPADRLAGLAAAAGQPDPPAMFDNLPELQARYQDSLASYRANRTRMLNTLTTLSLFGGAGLVVFVAMLALMSVPSGLRLWVPALGAAAVCVVIGVVLMNPERLKSGSSGAVAFAPFHLPPPELAPPAPASEGEPAGLTPGHAADLAEKQAGKAEVMKMKRMAPAAAPSPSTPGGLGSFGAAAPPQQSQVRGRGRSDDGGSASKSDAEGSPKAAGTTGRTDLSRLPEAIEMYIEPTQVPRAGGSTPGQPTDQSVVVGKRQVQVQQKVAVLKKDDSRELLERRGEVRGQASEFRFWQPLLETDARGKASLRFDVSARPARYRVLVDANSDAGGLGFGNGLVTVVLPLVPPQVPPAAKLQSMPAEVAARDQVNVPLLVAGYPQELSISGQIDGREEVVVRLPADALPG